MAHLDPHERPPEGIRRVYKEYQKMKPHDLERDGNILDLSDDLPASLQDRVRVVAEWRREDVLTAFRAFSGEGARDLDSAATSSVSVYEHEDMPAASSFFSLPPTDPSPVAHPLDPAVHKPLSIAPLLNKKLRWTTLGGQYDWTNKRYPDTPPPSFPHNVKTLLESLFTHTRAEAAIVNLYSPGDTLSVHRDVAENSPTGLVSLSLGCDAVFVIGTADKVVTLRLRSGSAVYMSGPSRFAWHGVPRIVSGTCPDHLTEWPASAAGDENNEFEAWRGWMRGKRVNLNVRQMWD